MYPDAAFTLPADEPPQATGCAITARGGQTGIDYAASSPPVRYPASCTLNYDPFRVPAGGPWSPAWRPVGAPVPVRA
jgi:hypothetical protein